MWPGDNTGNTLNTRTFIISLFSKLLSRGASRQLTRLAFVEQFTLIARSLIQVFGQQRAATNSALLTETFFQKSFFLFFISQHGGNNQRPLNYIILYNPPRKLQLGPIGSLPRL